jgi:hypothetical protein
MSVSQILSLVNALLVEWGVMPYISAGLVLLTVFGAITYIRRLGSGS